MRIAREITKFKQNEIRVLFKKAQTVLKHTALHILATTTEQEISRVLLIIPKKVGNAPDRNKIRRRLKALFYEKQLYKDEYDYIIMVKKKAVSLSFEQLKKLLEQAVTRAQSLDQH